MQDSEISKMKVADLKRELKLRGLSVIGNKTELMERLQSAIDGIEGDELLDETVLTDEDEANILAEDENELLKSPSSLKINIGESKEEDELLLSPTAPKKVVLKRKNSFKDLDLEGTATIATSKENTKPTAIVTEPKILKMSERNPIKVTSGANNDDNADVNNKNGTKTGNIKLSQLSEKERLELRAKKFGQISSTTTTTTTIVTDSLGRKVSEDHIEKLKKRAERFGVVSPAIAKLDENERLLKRKERFGNLETSSNVAASGGGGAGAATKNNDAWAEKARQRLERFKATTVADKQ